MCVIVLKFKGADFPSKNVIKACMKANPDGYAAAWNQDGRLQTFRTMDEAAMLAKYDEIRRLDPKTTGLVFHARIATHGSKTLANCHCWTNDNETIAFAHNGILHNIGNRDDMTDSETFFRDYFLPIMEGCGAAMAAKVANVVIGNSKFAFIYPNGDIVPLGYYMKDVEAGHKGTIYFSNMNWVHHSAPMYSFDKPTTKKKAFPAYGGRPELRKGPLIVERDDCGKIVRSYVGDPVSTAKEETPSLF